MADQYIPNRELLREGLDQWADVTGVLNAAKCVLWTNDAPFSAGPDTKFADLTQPTFTGYTAGGDAITWGTAYRGADGGMHLHGGDVEFKATAAPATAQEIRGYAIVTGASPNQIIRQMVVLGTPVIITLANEGFIAKIDVPLAATTVSQ